MINIRPVALPARVAGGYGVVLADPPWHFSLHSENGAHKSPQRHYPTLSDDELMRFASAIDLDFICAPDCALVMWATFPKLPKALDVMRAWGFSYKSGGAWAKMAANGNPAFGTGYLYRSAAEIWLLGVRGAPKVRSRSVRNLIVSQRGAHSVKPDQMHIDLEALFAGPYLELFARRRRAGWECWGDEVAA